MSSSNDPSGILISFPGGAPCHYSHGFIKWEFPGSCSAMNTARIVLRAGYPSADARAVNHECDMVVFVHKVAKGGSLEIVFATRDGDVKQECPYGTIISIPREKHYRWNVSSSATLIIVSNPPWHPEQAEVIMSADQ